MAASPPKSTAASAEGTEEGIEDENTRETTAEDTLIADATSKQQHADQGSGSAIELEEGDKHVIDSASDITLSETSNPVAGTPGAKLERDMDTYEEITKSEVASLDDWENVHKSCLSEIPPVDPEVLADLELRANDIAGNLDHMLATLANSLKAMSQVSTECLGAYGSCVDHVSETVDANIKSMYTLIARCEELNASLKPVQNLAEQVKEIKKTLDIFEAICK
ncbi:hypothetical protein ACROYT_G033160 [Oculina patagonica]